MEEVRPVSRPHTAFVVVLAIAGFIEYIVDPSFHVMGDAIGALTASLQQQCHHSNRPHAPAGSDDVIDDVTSSSSTNQPSPPPTPLTPPCVGLSAVHAVIASYGTKMCRTL